MSAPDYSYRTAPTKELIDDLLALTECLSGRGFLQILPRSSQSFLGLFNLG